LFDFFIEYITRYKSENQGGKTQATATNEANANQSPNKGTE